MAMTWELAPAFGRDRGQAAGTPKTCIDVYLEAGGLSPRLLDPAMAWTSGIFARIGVQLIWHRGLPGGVEGVAIHAIAHAPALAERDALATARPFGSEITLYRDRIERFMADHPADRSILFAYVLAHELAHVIQETDRHSASGILKAHWTGADYTEMRFHLLAFAEEDARLIRSGAAARRGQAGTQMAARR